MKKKSGLYLAGYILIISLIQACSAYYFRSDYKDANSLIHNTQNVTSKPFLKAHLKNGDVIILKDTWRTDTSQNLLTGKGKQYDFTRKKIYEGPVSISFDSIAIFETNNKIIEPENGRITALGLMTAVDVIIGILCITNPKACFGSCPTFYINENSNFHYADAEGFSDAIAPSTEYADIDALCNPELTDNRFSITMKNEALETHCINQVKLLAFPRKGSERIYHSPSNEFFLCENNYLTGHATGDEGDISGLLQKIDKQERYSLADNENMNSKEELLLTYSRINNSENLGILVNFRQTLMTTYLIYSALSYMGDEIGDVFAKIESSNDIRGKLKQGLKKELGNMEIFVWNGLKGDWEYQGGFYETGPIAINSQIVPLKISGTSPEIKIKIVLNRGLWRIDYVGLTNIKEKVKPAEVLPAGILNKGIPDHLALGSIYDPSKYLISMPGSNYKLNFILPEENTDYELFLYSKGYYLEWMRENWLRNKNLMKLHQMIDHPKQYLLEEAKNYKQYESTMEQVFWDSRIDTKTFVYHEN